MMESIKGFVGEYRWLSNFWLCLIAYYGEFYGSVEHAFQAQKAVTREDKMLIANADSPSSAKRIARKVMLRPDWEQVKVPIMLDILRVKFRKGGDLANRLLATGDMYLEETNTWHDVFWGVCNGKGQNMLGKLLMQVREELRAEEILNE